MFSGELVPCGNRTVLSVFSEAKDRKNETPCKVHDEIVEKAPQDKKSQAVKTTRDI